MAKFPCIMFAWRRWLNIPRLLGHSVQVNQRESVQQLDCNWHGLSKQALMWIQKPLDVRIRESRLRKSKVDSRFALRLETYEPFKNTNQEYKTLKWALYFWCFSSVWSERKQIHGQQWNGSYEIYSMLFCAMGTCFAESIGWYWFQVRTLWTWAPLCNQFIWNWCAFAGYIVDWKRRRPRQRVFQLYTVVNCLATWTGLAGSCFQPLVWVPLQWWVLLRSAEFDGEERRHVRHNAPVGTDSGWLLVRNCKGRSRLRPTSRCRQGVKFAARDTQVHGND